MVRGGRRGIHVFVNTLERGHGGQVVDGGPSPVMTRKLPASLQPIRLSPDESLSRDEPYPPDGGVLCWPAAIAAITSSDRGMGPTAPYPRHFNAAATTAYRAAASAPS